MIIDPTVLAVFLTGLLGGVHCAGMCGGIVGALGLMSQRRLTTLSVTTRASGRTPATDSARSRTEAPLTFVPTLALPGGVAAERSPAPGGDHRAADVHSAVGLAAGASPLRSALAGRLAILLPYNAGRLATYTLLGAAAGAAGSFGWLLGEALPVQQLAFAMTNVLLVLMGLYVAGWRRIGHLIERSGSGVWRHIKPLATASLQRHGRLAAVATGALWGLVPCGMVYAVLASALLSGSAAGGATLMLAFGLGTLPNLLLLGLSGDWLARAARDQRVRRIVGLLIVAFGLLGLLRLDVATRIPLLRELCVHLPEIGS